MRDLGLVIAFDAARVVSVPDGAFVLEGEVDVMSSSTTAINIFCILSNVEGLSFAKPIRVSTHAGFVSGGRFRGPDR